MSKLHREDLVARARKWSEEIGQMLTDYEFWNNSVRKPHEAPIDVDPGGLLRQCKEGIDRVLAEEDARPLPPFISEENKARLTVERMPLRPVPRAPVLLFCPDCGHNHQGEAVGFICIGCACEKRPPFTKLAL